MRHKLPKISTEELAEAEGLLQTLENDPEGAFLGEAHKRFHAIFWENPSRKLGKDILQNIYGNLTRLWVDFVKKKPSAARRYEEVACREHRELFAAAKRRNVRNGEALITSHIHGARDILITHMRELDRPASAGRRRRASAT
jgi:DNA-binding GntR family transcriptional regulator